MKKKFFKGRLAALILIMALFVSSCASKNPNEQENKKETSSEYLKVQEAFDEYMNELFVDIMLENSVSTHFSIENPEAYGIKFDEPTWGEPINVENIEADYKEQKEILDKLEDIDRNALSDSQKITYDTVYNYIKNSYAGKDLYLLDEVFAPNTGAQSEIALIFSEYEFLTKQDIEDYLFLMETVDDYLNNLLEYEKYRAEKGYFLTDTGADTVIKQCEDFISPEENCLVSIFQEKLKTFGVTDEEYNNYMERFNSALKNHLIKGFEDIIHTLTELKGSRGDKNGLSDFKDGDKFYSLLVRQCTGSDKSVEEIIEAVEESMAANLTVVYNLYSKEYNIHERYAAFEYPLTEPNDVVSMQIECAKKYFPEIDSIPYTIKSVPESLESTMSPAFYLVPPIDNIKKNIIYINHSEEYAHMNLFSTLAHEGAPGHMYQFYYYNSTNPALIRTAMNFNGYTEGWATYVEHYSYKFAGMDDSLVSFAIANDCYNFAIYCRLDLGIHYEGWDIDDCEYYLNTLGIYDHELVKELYNTLIDDPAVYLQYFVGYLEIMELRDKAEEKLDSFNETEFHEFLLNIGPTFFDIIEDNMDIWIKEQNM